MKTQLCAIMLAGLIVLPAAANAKGRGRGRGYGHGGPAGMGASWREPPPWVRERIQTQRVVELALRLQLSDNEAIALARRMQDFADQRRELRKQMHEAFTRMRSLAVDEKLEARLVDDQIARLKKLRQQELDLAHREFDSLAKGLSPAQRAKLVLFMHEFPRQMKRKMMQHGRQGRGLGGGQGQRRGLGQGAGAGPGPGPGW